MPPGPVLDAVTVTLNPAIDRTLAIRNFAAGSVHRVDAVRDTPGGKGVNVAAALAGFGLRVGATGFLARESAATFETLFARRKIEDHFVRIPGQARIGIKIADSVRKLTTDINFPGLAPSPASLAALRKTLSTLQAKWWILSGSLPPGVNPALYRQIVAALKKRGAHVALDASGEALREAIESAPQIVKPNLEELQTLLGKRLSTPAAIVKAARTLIAKGIDLVAVSMGKEGACFVTATNAIIARPPAVKIGSTVGAGDAMLAGIVAAHLHSLPLDESARLATAFSLEVLTNVERRISHAAVGRWMKKITVKRPPG